MKIKLLYIAVLLFSINIAFPKSNSFSKVVDYTYGATRAFNFVISNSDFQKEQHVLDTTKVNSPVLKIYNGYDFTGDVHEVYCGYYNGGLGDYED